jgi:hypothetical protein
MLSSEYAHGFVPPNRRKVTLVSVFEALSTFTPDRVNDVSRCRTSALHCRRSDRRNGFPFGHQHSQIANYENLRPTRDAEILVYPNATHAIELRSQLRAK